jgi:hypothetical protein
MGPVCPALPTAGRSALEKDQHLPRGELVGVGEDVAVEGEDVAPAGGGAELALGEAVQLKAGRAQVLEVVAELVDGQRGQGRGEQLGGW